jgi:hypothetical protein
LFGVPLLTAKVSWLDALGWWLKGTGEIFNRLARWF